MSLPINPLAKLISSSSQAIAAEAADAAAAVKSAGQAALDAKIDMLSGAAGTNLNGFASGISSIGDAAKGAAGDLANVIGGAASGIGGALSGIGSTVQSSLSGAVDSATGALGSLGGSLAGGLAGALPGGGLGGLIDSIGGGIAQKFNSAAGQVDDILSKLRGKNVPGGAELFPPAGGTGIALVQDTGNDWRVRINADWSIFDTALMKVLENTGGVVWPYTPTVSISTKANYTQIDPTHNNYPFQSYKNSQVEDITISGEFSCETAADAVYWIAATTFFKAATKMFFGQGEFAGNPPFICRLTGYGASIFNNVPVIIKSFTVDLRDDVDYINCYSGPVTSNTWVPVLSTISVTVTPVYNRERLRRFNLQDYTTGSPNRNQIGFI